MVHALKEIWRVLCVDGVLIDLRPISGTSRVEVGAGNRFQFAGLVDESLDIPNDLAANDSVTQILQAGWLIREQDTLFDYSTYWNSPDEMSAYAQEKWSNSFLPEAVLAKARRLMRESGNHAKVRIRREIIIARYRKQLLNY